MTTHFKKLRFITLLTLLSALWCAPAFAQDQEPPPTSPTPMPFQNGAAHGATPQNPATPGSSPGNSPAITPDKTAALLLSGYHQNPPKSVFKSQLANPKKVLLRFARNKKILPLQRQRALEALGYFADAQVEALYQDLLKNKQTAELVRHRVMTLLAINFPQTALPTLEPFLAHPDLQFRLTAIDAIRRIPGDSARLALQKAAKSETKSIAQKRLAQYLKTTR